MELPKPAAASKSAKKAAPKVKAAEDAEQAAGKKPPVKKAPAKRTKKSPKTAQ